MNVFPSDLAEALFEVIAHTAFKSEGEQYLKEIRVNEYHVELDKDAAKITLENNEEEFEIIIHKTYASSPPKKTENY